MKWQTGSNGLFYDCGESTVIYFDPASGDTHLISDFAAYVIQQLAGAHGSLDQEEIIGLIMDDIEPEGLAELTQAIPKLLENLADLDIITSA